MTWQEYQSLSPRTLALISDIYGVDKVKAKPIDLTHMSLGITSELYELDQGIENYWKARANPLNTDEANKYHINIGEECADILWYLSGAVSIVSPMDSGLIQYQFNFTTAEGDMDDYLNEIKEASSVFADMCKKSMMYGRQYKIDEWTHLIYTMLINLDSFTQCVGIDLAEVAGNNIEKLRVRYPDKFDADKAQEENRDLDAEFDALKGKTDDDK